MATQSGLPDTALKRQDPSVAERLLQEGYAFEFFQVVRLLERMYPARSPVGEYADPKEEVARFRSHVSFAFPPSQIHEIQSPLNSGQQLDVYVAFMGLAGAVGVLPDHYVNVLTDPRMRRFSLPFKDFLDIFNHRLVSLFYRAWEKYRLPIGYERGEGNKFMRHLLCLIGMGTPGLQNRLAISDQVLLYYEGLLSQRPRSAVALEGILQDYFEVPVEVIQFQGEWFHMNPENLTTLGPEGQNNRLGIDAVLWERIWDPQARFRLKIGPLTYRQFEDLLPAGDGYRHLVEMTRFFVGEEFNFEVQLSLRAEEVPWCVIGGSGAHRLGWSTWLKEKEFEEDTKQPVLETRIACG
jgi:type VI secretion system protein ImpH